jgi:hypothetical protein
MKTLLVLFALTTTAYAHRVCSEVSTIVGRQHCSQFGQWGLARLLPSFEIDVEMFREQFGSSSDVIARGGATVDNQVDAYGVRGRVLKLISGPLYLGGEIDLGGVMQDDHAKAGMLLAARLVAGAHVLLPGDFMISGELAGGGRVYDLTDQSIGVLEARGRFDWWATPHLTVGASIGTSLIDHTDHTFTFGIGGHVHAFDGHY